MGWIVAVAGLAVSAYSAYSSAESKKKAEQDANKANKDSVDATNKQNLAMYMRSRGVDANGNPVNTRLPEWAVMPGAGPVTGVRLKGTGPTATTTPTSTVGGFVPTQPTG